MPAAADAALAFAPASDNQLALYVDVLFSGRTEIAGSEVPVGTLCAIPDFLGQLKGGCRQRPKAGGQTSTVQMLCTICVPANPPLLIVNLLYAKNLHMTLPDHLARLMPRLPKGMRHLLKQRISLKVLARILSRDAYSALILQLAEARGNPYAGKTVICFARSLFDKDIEQLQYRLRGYRLLCVPPMTVTWPQTKHVPKHYRRQTEYAKHLDDTAAWSECIDFATTFLETAQRHYNVVGYLDANIDYWQTYAFQKSARRMGVPFFVLSKENPVTAAAMEGYRKRYKGFAFQGTAIACPSESLRRTFQEVNLTQEKDLWLTGFPRLDRYRSIDLSGRQASNVTFLSFREGYGLTSLAAYESVLSIVRKSVTEADAHQIERIFLKSKSRRDTLAHRRIGPITQWAEQDARVTIGHNIDLFDCFTTAQVIVGVNSQALLEALLTPAPIVIPRWAVIDDPAQTIFADSEGSETIGLYLSRTPEEFRQHLDACLRKPPVAQHTSAYESGRLDLLKRYVAYDREFSASHAVAEMIEHYCEDGRRSR